MKLESFDVVKILGYGLSGFAFLLVFLAFMLLRKEQDKPEPRKLIIQTIQMFMGLCLILSLAVGIISVPISSNNSQLQGYIQDGSKISSTGNMAEKTADKLVSNVSSMDPNGTLISDAEKSIIGNFEDAKTVIAENRPDDTVSINTVNKTSAMVHADFVKLKRPNQHPDTIKAAASRIQLNSRKIKAVALPLAEFVH